MQAVATILRLIVATTGVANRTSSIYTISGSLGGGSIVSVRHWYNKLIRPAATVLYLTISIP